MIYNDLVTAHGINSCDSIPEVGLTPGAGVIHGDIGSKGGVYKQQGRTGNSQ
jgi:hypothetical protein